MAAIFEMYSTKRYSKPVELWAAAVCRYLSSAYPSVTTSVLRLLVEVCLPYPEYSGHMISCDLIILLLYIDVRERTCTLSQICTEVDL